MTAALSRLKRVLAKKERTIIGLISGMSMDGVELALARFGPFAPRPSIELLDHMSFPYSAVFRRRLIDARHGDVREVCQLDAMVAHVFADAVNEFLSARGLSRSSIDAIGSHGQTLAHVPPTSPSDAPSPSNGVAVPSSLQVGNGNIIAQRTGLLVVSDFRQRDMSEGGQGAPLVALLDYYLYSRPGAVVAVNNLGSIANVTVVTPEMAEVLAFDAGPANMPIDYFAGAITDNSSGIDEDGLISASGSVCEPLLQELLTLPFLSEKPPKSAGYAEFSPVVLEGFARKYPQLTPPDRVRTAVELSAQSLVSAYHRFVLPQWPDLHQLIFSGGGVWNQTLMKRIRELLPGLKIVSLGDVDPRLAKAKEALAFALLAHATLAGHPTTLPQVTGARRAVVSGQISL